MGKSGSKLILTVDHANKQEDAKKLRPYARRRDPFRLTLDQPCQSGRAKIRADKTKPEQRD